MTKYAKQVILCNTCLQHFDSSYKLQRHKQECSRIVTKVPDAENSKVSFKNFKHKLDVPFVVYADFECFLTPENTQNSGSIRTVQSHIPCAYSYYIKCSFNNSLDKFRIYTGEDAPIHFITTLVNDAKEIYNNYLSKIKPMNFLIPLEFDIQNKSTAYL